MQETIRQVEAYLAGAIPTALLFTVLVIAYQLLVQGPLTAALVQRRARTEGALEDAQKAIAQAEARMAEYVTRLRQAHAELYQAREQRLKQRNVEREAALEAARKVAALKVFQAKAELEGEVAAARQSIQAAAGDLAKQVVRVVLPAAAGGSR